MATLTGDINQKAQIAAKTAFEAELKKQTNLLGGIPGAKIPHTCYAKAQKAGKAAYDATVSG